MGLFAARATPDRSVTRSLGHKLASTWDHGAPVESAAQAHGSSCCLRLPHFEAIADALVSGDSGAGACSVAGRELAKDGVGLGEALQGLRETFLATTGAEPTFDVTTTFCLGWGEETLSFVNTLSCEDPLTGLASTAHVRARLMELYRAKETASDSAAGSFALVVVDLPVSGSSDDRGLGGDLADQSSCEAVFGQTLTLVRLGETVRLVFAGDEVMAQAGRSRLIVLCERGPSLGRKVGALRTIVEATWPARVWIEGLPPSIGGAVAVLDEVTRA